MNFIFIIESRKLFAEFTCHFLLFGGPDGELGASQRYLSQRYSNTNRKVCGVLTDIGIYVSVETIVSTPVK